MTRTTPPRPVAMADLFPELVPFRRETLRLHPRPGDPTCHDSSVGGPLLWPADEPWPTCAHEDHSDFDGNIIGVMPLVPVVQVRQADAPGIDFPAGRDLLQVLWCPLDHDDYAPLPQVHWRDSSSITDVADTPATPADPPEDYVPNRCVVHPEQVAEYPSADLPTDLTAELADRFDQLERETGWIYPYHLAEAPGIKLGGYPGWTQDPDWPDCPSCEQPMHHLLTVASCEVDGESWRTWTPIEDRVEGPHGPSHTLQNVAGLMLGDCGGVYIFECQSCQDRPYAHRFDCS